MPLIATVSQPGIHNPTKILLKSACQYTNIPATGSGTETKPLCCIMSRLLATSGQLDTKLQIAKVY